jgi:hypothetical protein
MIILLACAFASPAMAYVGPGSSLGAIGIAMGFLAAIILTLLSFVWYPLKRLARRVRRRLLRTRPSRPAGAAMARQARRP